MACVPVNAATNKCTDGMQITYANVPCEDMGLRYAGPIKNLVTVLPPSPKIEEATKENVALDSSTAQTNTQNASETAREEDKPARPLVKLSPN